MVEFEFGLVDDLNENAFVDNWMEENPIFLVNFVCLCVCVFMTVSINVWSDFSSKLFCSPSATCS